MPCSLHYLTPSLAAVSSDHQFSSPDPDGLRFPGDPITGMFRHTTSGRCHEASCCLPGGASSRTQRRFLYACTEFAPCQLRIMNCDRHTATQFVFLHAVDSATSIVISATSSSSASVSGFAVSNIACSAVCDTPARHTRANDW